MKDESVLAEKTVDFAIVSSLGRNYVPEKSHKAIMLR
jgi:hypothetical protein